MASKPLHERVIDQFSYQGEHADIWRGFDLLLETEEFLNLGYSKPYQPHLLGSSQQRLATEISSDLANRFPSTGVEPLLDVGCGRGGPSIHLAESLGINVIGVDLVSYNIATARANARRRSHPVEFVVGDMTQLPWFADTFGTCTAIDSLVYVPEKQATLDELARVIYDDGVLVISDLLKATRMTDGEVRTVDEFADSWDMAPLSTIDRYRRTIERAGFEIEAVRDITGNSVGRFRKWTSLYLLLATHFEDLLKRLFDRFGLDFEAISTQVQRAHEALPHLRHAIVYARRRSPADRPGSCRQQ